ncbi:autotransporter-associated beta strand repeat-containing protein [Rhodanobacter sp. DHB23]|uniref:autotransporter-associated beta strand repeat-containing protein n=1 Tax=Rhodanobacter sp. DHB23 TaxID=2775923 RepID=UPI0017862500|nr:autotransporter-associated beta strand repeat-containing protein [Rhodanobacter sp. DHB23]MBD8872774.1 autotransporter-associated beta strand repeat-containing protein [Rhodanobacter sp. DHB23]
MNRIYRLVWNRALRVLQVASEFAHSQGGAATGEGTSPLRRHPLAMALTLVLTAALSVVAPQVAAQVPPIGGQGGAGGNSGGTPSGSGGASGSGGGAYRSNGNSSTSGVGGSGGIALGYYGKPAANGGTVGTTLSGTQALSSSQSGGAGAAGATVSGTYGYGGGGGGAAVYVSGAGSLTINNGVTLSGGHGGAGGSGFYAGGGGGGGDGVLFSAGGTIINNGTISGGNGGAGGASASGGGGGGGGGGSGIAGAGLTITNYGTINGGSDGAGGSGPHPGSAGSNGDAILFTSGSNTLTLESGSVLNGAVEVTNIATATIDVAASGLNLSGGTLGNSALITNGVTTIDTGLAGTSTTISGVISGSAPGGGALVLTDSGTLTLSGTNTYTGGTTMTGGGTLVFGNDSALGTGALEVASNVQLDASATVSIANAILILNSDALTVLGTNDLTLSGVISGGGAAGLTKNGLATLTLAGANTYAGGTYLNAGGLVLDTNTALSSGVLYAHVIGGGTVTLDTDAPGLSIGNDIYVFNTTTLDVLGSNDLTLSGTISNGGALIKDGVSTLTLSGTNSYTGGTTINAGAIAIAADDNLGGSTSGLTLNGGTLENMAAMTSVRTITLGANGGTLETDDDMTLDAAISGTGSLTKTGTGTLTLNGSVADGTNSYSGGTYIDGGTVVITSDASLGVASGGLTLNGGTLEYDGGNIVASTRAVTLGSQGGTFDITNSFGSIDLTGVVSGTGALTATGPSTLELDNANNSYAGGTFINGGAVVYVAADGALGLASSSITINGAWLRTADGFSSGRNILVGGGGAYLTIDAGATTLSGTIDEELGVTNSTVNLARGSGTLVFTGTSTGPQWMLQGGQSLELAGIITPDSPSTTPAILLTGGGNTLTLDSGFSLGGNVTSMPNGTSGDTLALGGTVNGTFDTSAITSTAPAWTGTPEFYGFASYAKTGSSTWTVTGSGAAMTGTWTISSGMLQVGDLTGDGSLGTGDIINDAALVYDNTGNTTAANNISGTGTLTQEGAGTLTLTGNNSYGGGTYLTGTSGNPGRLIAESDTALGTGAVNVQQYGQLQFQSPGNDTNGNPIEVSAGSLTINNSTDTSNTGVVFLQNTDAGTAAIINTSGTTVFSSGSSAANATITNTQGFGAFGVIFEPGSTAGSASITNSAGGWTLLQGADAGTATFTNSYSSVAPGNITNPNSYASGMIDLGGAVTASNATIINGANSAVFISGAGPGANAATSIGSLSGAGNVLLGANYDNSNSTYDIPFNLTLGASNQNDTISGVITDDVDMANLASTTAASNGDGIIKVGTGTLTLTGINTYSGGTTISGGILSVAADDNLGASTGGLTLGGGTLENTAAFTTGRSITLTADSTLQTDASLEVDGSISGGYALTKTGSGTLTLTGSNSYAGTSLDDGEIDVGNASALGSGTVAMAQDTTLGFTTSGLTLANAFTLTGDPTFDVAAGNTETVSGVISDTDPTTPGIVEKTGGGTLELTANNTYSGGTTLSAGTLVAGSQSNYVTATPFGSGTVTMAAGTTLGFDSTLFFGDTLANAISITGPATLDAQVNGQYTISGAITGTTGAVDITGGGGLTLSGNNSFGAGLDVQAGYVTLTGSNTGDITIGGFTQYGATSLTVGNGGTSGSISGDVVDNGYLYFERSDSLTYSGTISGTGGVNVSMGTTGVLTLDGTNTYDGSGLGSGIAATQVASGTLDATPGALGTGLVSVSGGGSINANTGLISGAGAALNIAGTGSFTNDVTNTGSSNVKIVIPIIPGIFNLTTYEGTPYGGTINFGQGVTLGGASQSIVNGFVADVGGISLPATPPAGLTIVISNGAISGGTASFNGNADAGSASIENGMTMSGTFSGIPGLNNPTTIELDTDTLSGGTLMFADSSTADAAHIHNGISISGTLSGIGSATGDINALTNSTLQGGTLAFGTGTSAGSASIDNSLDVSGLNGGLGSPSSNGGTLSGDTVLGGNVTFAGTASAGSATIDNGTNLGSFLTGLNTDTVTISSNTIGGGNITFSGTSSAGSGTYDNGLSTTDAGISVVTNGTITNNTIRGGTITFAGSSDAGTATFDNGVTLNGATTGTLTGSNGNVMQGGTVYFNGSSTAANATVNDGFGGILDISGHTGTLALGQVSGDAASSILLGGNILETGGLGGNTTFAGVIADGGNNGGTGGGLTKAGTGTLTLDGSNTYTGLTEVAGGTLLVGDASSPTASIAGNAQVDSGATLGGHGTIVGNVNVLAGGIVAPGGSIGTLTVNGNFTAAQGSVLDYELGAPGANLQTAGTGDRIVVGGNLTLNGATLNVTDAGGMGPGLYNIFSYSGTLTEANGGLTLGTTPAGQILSLQTLSNQINLIDSSGVVLAVWNANGLASATQMGGGSGTWSTTSANWTDAAGTAPNGAMSPQPGFAVFGGAAGTVTVAGTVSATGMQFVSSGYTLTGGTINLMAGTGGATPVVNVGDGNSADASITATVADVIAGTAGLDKTDYGTLVLTGANTYTGGTTIGYGTLALGAGGSLAATGAVTLAGTGTTFDLGNAGANETIGALDGVAGSTVNLGANGLTFGDATSTTFAGVIAGSGGITKQGTGTATLSGANTFTGGTTIDAGTLAIGANGSLASTGALNLAAAGAAFDISAASSLNTGIGSLSGVAGSSVALGGNTLVIAGSGNTTFSGSINGTGGVKKAGTGTQTLDGASTYGGGTTLAGGELILGNDAALGTGALTVAGSPTLDANSALTIGNAITIDSNLDVLGSNALTFGGTISGAGALTKDGAATLTLTGADTFTGGTVVNSGTLALGAGASLASTGAVLIDSSGATFDISGAGANETIGALQGASGSIIKLGGNSLAFGDASSQTFAGSISGTGGITMQGTGTETLTGANAYTGGTTISAGALVASTASLPGNVIDNAMLVFNQAGNGTFAGAISGNGGVTKSGAGALVLDGNSGTFTGTTTVATGTLAVGDASTPTAMLGGNVTVASGATLAGHGTIGGNVSVLSGGIVAPGGSIGTLTVNGDFAAAQGSLLDYELGAPGATLQTAGTGDRIAVGGNLTLDGATLNVTDAGGMGAGLYTVFTWGGTLTESNGGLALGTTPASQILSLQTLSNQINLIDSVNLALAFWNANGQASATQMGGGNGTWSTTSANWTDAAGTAPNGAMDPQPGFAVFGGAAGTVTVDDSAGAVQATGMQFINSGYTLTGGTLTLVGSGGAAPVVRVGNGNSAGAAITATIADVIAGSAGLDKTDYGTLVLTGANTYTGATTISGGTLALSGAGSIAASSGVADNGTFDLSGSTGGASIASLSGTGAVALGGQSLTLSLAGDSFGGVIGGSGGLALTAGTETLTGSNTYTGATTISGGTLALSGTGSIAASSGVADNGTFDISGNANGASIASLSGTGTVTLGTKSLTLSHAGGSFGGVIGGSGSLALTTGTETLTGANTYTGATTISGGTLALSGTGSIAASSGVADNGTLDLSGTANGASIASLSGTGAVALGGQSLTLSLAGDSFGGVIGGSGGLALTAGTETLTGANAYTGGTTISAGTLVASTASLPGNVIDNAMLVFNQAGNGTFAGAISGNGSVTKSGAGTLVLDGNSSAFAGSTTVASGTLEVGDATTPTATLGGNVTVASGATLAGHGSIGGNVSVLSGGIVAPGGSIGTLTVNGDFAAAQGSVLDYELGAPGATLQTAGTGDRIAVGGNLTLDGATLNITDAGGMGAGIYTLFTWGGTLTESNGGLALGTVPAGQTVALQTLATQKEINLVDSTGLTLAVWNANGQASATQMGGGSGTWSATSANWTNASGTATNGAMQPQPGFAVFGGAAGTVTVDDSAGAVQATGLQFASSGYTLTGGTITLVGSGGAAPVIRVGNGTSAGSTMTATIADVIAGTAGLDKTDYGTLVLTAANTYSGGTTLGGGTLVLGNDGALGTGALTVAGAARLDADTAVGIANDIALDNNLDVLGSNAITLGGTISGTGSLSKDGAATLTLTGADTFTGGTTINAGTLALGAGASLASTGAVALGSGATFDISGSGHAQAIGALSGASGSGIDLGGNGLAFGDSTSQTFAGAITGMGGITKQGAGTETLAGVNTYTGATTIASGTLALSGSGSLAASSGVTDNGTLDISGSTGGASITSLGGNGAVNLGSRTLTLSNAGGSFAGVIGGSGGLTLAGGTETLTGANTYTGATTIGGGTLALSGKGSLAASSGVTDNGMLDISASTGGASITSLGGSGAVNLGSRTLTLSNASGSFAGVIGGSGGLAVTGGSETLTGANTYTGGTTIGAGTLTASAASLPGNITDNAALVLDQAGDGTFAGAISGNGSIAKSGAGSLILDGDSSAFAGTTTVQAGTLEVGDAATPSAMLGGNVTVASGATLRGHGTIAGDVSNNGTVWAGGSVGTLTIGGNFTQGAGGVLEAEITATGQASLLAVNGTATLAGGTLVLADSAAGLAYGPTFTILTATGGVSGTFASLTTNFAFISPTLVYAANAVELSLPRNAVAFPDVALTANERAAATGTQSLGLGNAVYDGVLMLDVPTARHAFDQLSGEIHASVRTAIADNDHYVRDAINQHLAGQGNDANGLNVTDADGVTAWTSAWGHWGSHDGDGNASTMDGNGSGLLFGVDMPVGGEARLGAVMGTGEGSTRIDALGSDAHTLDQHLGIYGSAQTGALLWQGAAIYGWQKVDTHRSIGFGSFDGTADSSYRARTTQAYIDGSLPFALGNTVLAPFANLAVERLGTPAVRENGTPAALDVAAQDSTVGYGTLGLRASFDLGAANHGLHAHASLGWQHAWGDVLPVDTMRFASGGDSFDIAGTPVLRNAGVANLGISFTIAPDVSVDGTWQGQFGKQARDQSGRISLDWKF